MSLVLHLSHTNIKCDSRILKEMTCLVNHGYDVAGIGVEMDEGVADSKLSGSLSIQGISIVSRGFTFLPTIIRHAFTVFEISVKMFRETVKRKPAVIHCHDTLVLPLGVVAKLLTGAKLIYDAHELESDRNGLSKFAGKLTWLIERILWSKVDGLNTVSSSIEQWYHENFGKKKSVVVLNSPVLEDGMDNEPNNYLRSKFDIPKNQKIFIYVGILAPGRGIEFIAEAFKKIEGKASVVFLGYGKLFDYLSTLSESFESIHVHNPVKHELVVPIAKSADVGLCFIENVSLSDYYCLPNKLFEYCFAGLPILASNLPEIELLTKQYGVGDTCAFEPESIIASINKFINGDVEAKYDINSLYPLSWQAQEEKLVKFYKSISA